MEKQQNEDLVNINFVGLMNVFVVISVGLTIASLILIFTKGLNYGIDFAGGAEMQVQFQSKVSPDEVRKWAAETGFPNASVQGFGDENGNKSEYLIKVDAKIGKNDQETNQNLNASLDKLKASVKEKWPDSEIRRIDTVGPQVGSQMKRNGVLAVFYAILCILIYVGLRFDYNFAPGAVVCLFHDAVVTLGVFCILNKEINLHIMAAILTIIGYSLNDTIVIFDRIRETMTKYKDMPMPQVINMSINSTLNRTILTIMTTFVAVLALYEFAGGVIEEFAFAMIVGILLGSYSSIYVASPFIILLERFKKNTTRGTVTGRPARA